jgi:hypothetical protein
MCQAIPAPMLTQVTALAETLSTWAMTQRDAALADQEQAVLAAVRVVLPALLTRMLQLSTRDLDPHKRLGQRACPGCGRSCRVHPWRWCQGQTLCGRVRLQRP